ncbi:MAG TPA: exodeoxyribonuclease V subunit alpha [Nevskiaceae bacterium]|nr:exodeoxyribonuclease V subunit alpha [Nevskiaceae bacterium]
MNTLERLANRGRLRRADLALAQWLAHHFSDPQGAVALAAALASRAVADGHSALQLDAAQAWFETLDEDGTAARLPTIDWPVALRASDAVYFAADSRTPAPPRPLVLDGQGRLYLRRYFEYERRLANALVERARTAAAWLPAAQQQPSDALDPRFARALQQQLTIVTGGPGTGKTYSVARMLVALARAAAAQAVDLRIALAAPTGKAAARLSESISAQLTGLDLTGTITERIPSHAQTLHRLLGISPWRPAPTYNAQTPLPFDVVVVDEVSMVDLPMMAKLVDAVAANARLILLGDPAQLAAVEAGDVLGSLVSATQDEPLMATHVALTRSHRFAGDSTLARLAQAITLGDAAQATQVLANNDPASASLCEASTARPVATAYERYLPVIRATGPAEALHAAARFRLLTALRRGPHGCEALDSAIALCLKQAAGVAQNASWWRGRLILITANRPELKLFNGDIGVVWPDADGALQAWFASGADDVRHFSRAVLPAFEGAFAITVHKAQGSEFDEVALVTGPDSAVLTRELLYTGVTRARSRVTLYGHASSLDRAIARRTVRFSGLADRLREAAHGPA